MAGGPRAVGVRRCGSRPALEAADLLVHRLPYRHPLWICPGPRPGVKSLRSPDQGHQDGRDHSPPPRRCRLRDVAAPLASLVEAGSEHPHGRRNRHQAAAQRGEAPGHRRGDTRRGARPASADPCLCRCGEIVARIAVERGIALSTPSPPRPRPHPRHRASYRVQPLWCPPHARTRPPCCSACFAGAPESAGASRSSRIEAASASAGFGLACRSVGAVRRRLRLLR